MDVLTKKDNRIRVEIFVVPCWSDIMQVGQEVSIDINNLKEQSSDRESLLIEIYSF